MNNHPIGRTAVILLFALTSHWCVAALPNTDAVGNTLPSLAPMLKTVNPAVVNISTYSTQRYNNNPLLNDPFFKHFFNMPDPRSFQERIPKKRQQSAGSGVIVNASKGVVMTNHHVIKGADEVRVSLTDGRSFNAKIIGSDADLDIAILEIEADNLAEVKLADSNQLEVGDFVVAIGNPFGLGQTVTTGIVSALGRSGLGIEGYENFIQTDASINPGNSGGALVNLRGDLVGINTAIIAPAGGNVGIGFAIPANMAKASMEQLLEHGEVRRGHLGIGIQDITPDLREAFNLKNGQLGVLISKVFEDSPAEKAGLKSGDVVIAVDNQTVTSSAMLRSQVGIKRLGDKVTLAIIRAGKRKDITCEVGKPKAFTMLDKKVHSLLDGARFENHPGGRGVVVAELSPNSGAAYSGLRRGDIIISANRQPVYNIKSLKKALRTNSERILMRINRNGGSLYLVIR